MKRVYDFRPRPALVIAVVALIAALAGTAVADPGATTSKITKSKVKKIVNKLAPGLSVAHANTADSATNATTAANANQLDGQSSAAFQTASASDERTNTLAMTTSNQTVLSTTITVPAQKTVTAVASIEMVSDGGGNDNNNCNLAIDGTNGVRQSTYVTPNGLEDSTTLPLTQSLVVGAGTHTVLAECSEGGVSNTSVEERSLSVVATG